jgi:signal peptidase
MPASGDDDSDRESGPSSESETAERATERQGEPDSDSGGSVPEHDSQSDTPPSHDRAEGTPRLDSTRESGQSAAPPRDDSRATGPPRDDSRAAGNPADMHADEQRDEPATAPEQPGTAPVRPGTSTEHPGPPPRRAEETTADDGGDWWLFVRDVTTSVLAVLLIGAYLFAISGVWPPMVAIESGSMEPQMNVNDLVFVMESERFQPADAASGTGIVTARIGAETGYEQFGNSGDVIVFEPNGASGQTPIIHRAMFWVEEGENWVAIANESYLGGVDSCEQIRSCPAPHDGFITKGDNNGRYDQAGFGQSNEPVKPEWIVGTAEVRIPKLGWFRLRFQG